MCHEHWGGHGGSPLAGVSQVGEFALDEALCPSIAVGIYLVRSISIFDAVPRKRIGALPSGHRVTPVNETPGDVTVGGAPASLDVGDGSPELALRRRDHFEPAPAVFAALVG